MDGTERKIVFWYDDDAAYSEEVDQLQLAGESKDIKLTGSNNFATKLLLEHQDLTTNYLVYAPFARPEDSIYYKVKSSPLYSENPCLMCNSSSVRGVLSDMNRFIKEQ